MPNTPNGIYYPPQGAPATLRSFFTNLATTADAALTTLRQDLSASILGTRAIADNAIQAVALFTGAPLGRIRMQDGGQAIASSSNGVGSALALTLTQQPTTAGVRPSAGNSLVATRTGPHVIGFAGGYEPINTPTGTRAFEIRVNASGNGTGGYRAGERQTKSVAGDGRVQITYTTVINLIAGDTVQAFGIQTQGAGVTVSQQTELYMYWLRPSL